VRSRFCLVLSLVALLAVPAAANPFFFTGNPDGKIATLARVGSLAGIQTETADDFLLIPRNSELQNGHQYPR